MLYHISYLMLYVYSYVYTSYTMYFPRGSRYVLRRGFPQTNPTLGMGIKTINPILEERCSRVNIMFTWQQGYLPKFSDSFAAELMKNEAMDFNLCRRILSDYHPLHMILLLKSTVNICELRELLAL